MLNFIKQTIVEYNNECVLNYYVKERENDVEEKEACEGCCVLNFFKQTIIEYKNKWTDE